MSYIFDLLVAGWFTLPVFLTMALWKARWKINRLEMILNHKEQEFTEEQSQDDIEEMLREAERGI